MIVEGAHVVTHDHLYQWVTRGLAVDNTLFEWLTTLCPVWAGIDEHAVHTGASGALARFALTGCTTSSDHHYVFPCEGGDVFAAEIRAAQDVGLRFHPCRGSMDLGRHDGGLPPDHVVESAELARELGVRLHTHLAETLDEEDSHVLGSRPPLELLVVDGRPVVERDRLLTVDTDALARECATVHRTLLEKAS